MLTVRRSLPRVYGNHVGEIFHPMFTRDFSSRQESQIHL